MLKKIKTALLRFNPVTRYRKTRRNKEIIKNAFLLFHSLTMSPSSVTDPNGNPITSLEELLQYSILLAEKFERIKENYFYFKK